MGLPATPSQAPLRNRADVCGVWGRRAERPGAGGAASGTHSPGSEAHEERAWAMPMTCNELTRKSASRAPRPVDRGAGNSGALRAGLLCPGS